MKNKIKYLVFSVCFFLSINISFSQHWNTDTANGFYLEGITTTILSFYKNNNMLYIAGGFGATGGIPNNSIAIWDSTTWYSLDGGIPSGGIYTMQQYNNELYVGGGFSDAGGVFLTEHFAAWNDTNWHAVGTLGAVYQHVLTSAIYENKLFIGGGFTKIGSVPNSYKYIAAWNDTAWINVGSMISQVNSLAVMNGELYATDMGAVKKYLGGTTWEQVGGYANFYTDQLMVDTINSFLYSGGQFNTVDDSILCDGVAYWDGFKWNGIMGGVVADNGAISALAMYRGELYAGIAFDTIDGIPVNHIARWTGTGWDTLGCGLNHFVYALQVYKDELYVGGVFDTAGGKPADGLARWYMPSNTSCNYLKPIAETYADTFYLINDTVTVQFYNNNPYVTSWNWDFDDGNFDTIREPLHTYTDTGIYNVCVTVNDTGCVKTACKEIVVVLGTGINEYTTNTKVSIFPNPSTAKITIQAEGIIGVEVMDITGKVIKNLQGFRNLEGLDIDLSKNPKGIYIIKVTTNKGVAVQKIVLE